ncbi:flagellar hook-associated protein FlgK [Rhodoblastus acidophilus]|uniref:Flagellar hook-associated protein 1 n=1 Tax=Candidatus Rhodoblastus alkanivorans TaxID=2954117 RepID=A0ABS9Z3D6_9HYPH|nr:flagellar hook-associated protein FlgK [Candidatus Rhodoblastus alkanivorans]MCI4678792.1 flagellar hook-associated protein FlgK [Candidatus Rhodoblastus alkanivorans]MCI4682181.1 flagellar hook-associated protein FlgK [Candidatus Rhodoblastus alkanivorans]MDI4639483.1 flagellar hook-associated protein FlgK [Rhodoblastus acidophilus]
MGLSNAWDVATTSLATNAGLTSIVSRNISNAQNTAGYVSTKVANLVTGSNGAATIASISDLANATLFNSMLSSTSANASAQALSTGVTQLQQTVSDATTTSDSSTAAQSPSTLLQSLSTALQTYSSSPGSASAASAVLTAAQSLASGLNSASATVASVRETADQDMVNSVSTVNSLLAQFQDVNNRIVKGTATGSDISNALDQRNTILQSLSQQIGITTTTGSNGSMSIYTDSGATLFDVSPRSVTMTPTTTYTASTTGAAVYVDGVPVTGANAVMPIQSGALAGYANLRDNVAPQYQAQLDSIAGGLVNAFAETNSSTGAQAPGLFTYAGATGVPGSSRVSGLAGEIEVSSAVDPSQGGSLGLIRDGGINGLGYVQNSTGASGYSAVIQGDIAALSATTAFPSAGGLSTSTSLSDYAANSASWLDGEYQTASSQATYQSTLQTQASQALSNAIGVNIDTQMSKMLDLENSYQASAKLISTINTMFGALLQAVA